MNLMSRFVAVERNRWRIGCALALAGMIASLCFLNRTIPSDSGRLYWEYAGRILHKPVTNGYIEWIQHRVGVLPALASAAPAARQLAPYTGFPSEYPPGSLLYFAALRYFVDGMFGFTRLTHICAAAMFVTAMAISLHYIRKMHDRSGGNGLFVLYLALPFAAISPVLIGPFALSRFDMLPTIFAMAGLALFLEQRPLGAVFMLGLGASTKLWPGIFIPLLMANYWQFGTRNTKSILMAIFGIAGFVIPHAIMLWIGTSPADIMKYMRFLGDRPPQVESFAANIVVVLSHLTGSPVTGGFDFGSQNVYSAYSNYVVKIASIFNVLVLAFGFFSVLQNSRRSENPAALTIFACGLCVCITMLCSRVFSSEYMMWPLPLIMFLFLDKRGLVGVAAFVCSLVLIKAIYWEYDDILAVKLYGTLVSFGKNVMFSVVAWTFGSSMLAARSRPE